MEDMSITLTNEKKKKLKDEFESNKNKIISQETDR